MKRPVTLIPTLIIPLLAFLVAVPFHGAEPKHAAQRKLDPRLQAFFKAKEQHARALTKELKLNVSPDVWSYFDAGIKGDWVEVKRSWRELSRRSGQYTGSRFDETVGTVAWQPVLEAELAYEGFSAMDTKFIDAFSRDVIDSIPRGSIYFGGTDYGRGLITALCKSHANADPFFTITQNALASGPYLAYLRAIYGKKLTMPTDEDSKTALDAYIAAARVRSEKGELEPGENLSKDEKGNYSVSGTKAVMGINALIAKTIFESNPRHEFYIEESFPLQWMYPHLSANGLIMKLNRTPLAELTAAMVEKDQAYWRKQTTRWIGDWLKEETPLKKIGEFTERLYVEVNLEEFKGDQDFAMADRRYSPQSIYSRLRTAQATVYAWRAKSASTPEERQRMAKAADFAYRQAFALCPWAHEAVFRYEEFLNSQNRKDEALLLVETAAQTNPGDKRLLQHAEKLKEK
jgi:hypothetical protein